MKLLCDQHCGFSRRATCGECQPRVCTVRPIRDWRSPNCGGQRRGISVAAARTRNYPAALARHWSAARDGSLILLWASWPQWPPGKALSNLKFLSHLVSFPHVAIELLFQVSRHSLFGCTAWMFRNLSPAARELNCMYKAHFGVFSFLVVLQVACVQYDAYRLPPELLESIGHHVAAAVKANVVHWNRHQRSRAILMLSRLLLVPDEGLWQGLVSGLLSHDGHLTLPEAQQRSADIAHTAGQADPTGNPEDKVVLKRQKRTLKRKAGKAGKAHSARQGNSTTRTRSPMSSVERNRHREAMARIGLLYSVSVMHMLSSGSQAGSWGTVEFGCMEHHLLPDQTKMPSVKQWATVPQYLELPADTLQSAVSSWRSVNKHIPEIDGVWLPLNHGKDTRKSSPLEKSVVKALQNELKVPIMQEAVLEGSYVAVDVAIIGKVKRKKSAVFVAVEVQGPHHFVSRKAKERRSSRVKQLLRQHAGWHVVALSFKEWKGTGIRSRRQLLREKLSVLPAHCWKPDDVAV